MAVSGAGLEGIIAAESSICYIDGDAGVLSYNGFNIHTLAEKATFEKRAETDLGSFAGPSPDRTAGRQRGPLDHPAGGTPAIRRRIGNECNPPP